MGALFLLPVCCLLAAGLMGQFSLLDRVSLFIMPVLLVLIGYGMCVMFMMAKQVVLKALPQLVALISIISFAGICMKYPWKYEEVCNGLNFAKEHKIEGDDVFIYHGTAPAYVYYTTIHPDKEQWVGYKDVHVLEYCMNTDSLAQDLPEGSYTFIYTNQGLEDYSFMNAGMEKHMLPSDVLEAQGVKVFIYRKD